MPTRPTIPVETRRAVLLAARNHCAVCCTPVPLELAHIVPWRKTKDHSAANLIALCANCHSLADKENWGAQHLKAYRDNPCILAKNGIAPLTPDQKAVVDLIINSTIEEMSEKQKLKIVSMIAAYLEIDLAHVEILSIKPWNSVKVTISLPRKSAQKLIDDFKTENSQLAGFFDDVHVTSISFANPDHDIPNVVSFIASAMAKKAPWLPPFVDAIANIVTTGDDGLFEYRGTADLTQKLSAELVLESFLSSPNVSSSDVEVLLSEREFSDHHLVRINVVLQLLQSLKTERLSQSEGHADEDGGASGGEDETPPDTDYDDSEEGEQTAAKIKQQLAKYTFQTETALIYETLLSRSPRIRRITQMARRLYDRATILWETVKSKLKAMLSALGLEGVFIVLDRLSERYGFVRILLKILGSLIVPMIILITTFSMLTRFMANPFRHMLNWLAKEFDFKMDPDSPSE